MIIVDPGRGNLRSVQKALQTVGVQAVVTADPDVVRKADRVVLPGVGAFGDCMDTLRSTGLAEAVTEVVDQGRPYLGICLGMHVLFEGSEEFGRHAGMGWLPGSVQRLTAGPGVKVPHMGWNRVTRPKSHWVLGPEGPGEHYYFVHSFHAVPAPEAVGAWCDHGGAFAAAVVAGENVVAVQFHPEKSQADGLALLDRFARWSP